MNEQNSGNMIALVLDLMQNIQDTKEQTQYKYNTLPTYDSLPEDLKCKELEKEIGAQRDQMKYEIDTLYTAFSLSKELFLTLYSML